ncbi:hypothetical protein KUTeg_018330 [Tegillarca granosa]|uniref:Uncharacterized protein n=1 Tax=Tegillarca granosa TaxID=220873 RepID=A0ABQ9EHK0_TEGGR|nr:hypothetical protein KUTeg_018330 [Tegillarca granosa]
MKKWETFMYVYLKKSDFGNTKVYFENYIDIISLFDHLTKTNVSARRPVGQRGDMWVKTEYYEKKKPYNFKRYIYIVWHCKNI